MYELACLFMNVNCSYIKIMLRVLCKMRLSSLVQCVICALVCCVFGAAYLFLKGYARSNAIHLSPYMNTTMPTVIIADQRRDRRDTVPTPFILFIMNIPAGAACRHMNNLQPLVCISTSESTARIVRVDVPDNWAQLGRRMLLALPQIYARYNASWYFKVDTDTATDFKRLERALRGLAPGVSYVGQVYSYDNSPDYASGGAGYGIRRAALANISGENQRCKLVPSEHTNYEDVSVGACLHLHGVSVTQLDGLYGDNVRDSALLASGALVFRNHKFTVNVTIPVLTMHKSSGLDCMGSTVLACANTRLAPAILQFNFRTQDEQLAEFVVRWTKLCPTSTSF